MLWSISSFVLCLFGAKIKKLDVFRQNDKRINDKGTSSHLLSILYTFVILSNPALAQVVLPMSRRWCVSYGTNACMPLLVCSRVLSLLGLTLLVTPIYSLYAWNRDPCADDACAVGAAQIGYNIKASLISHGIGIGQEDQLHAVSYHIPNLWPCCDNHLRPFQQALAVI